MATIFAHYFPNVVGISDQFIQSTWETIYMVVATAIIAGILGLVLG